MIAYLSSWKLKFYIFILYNMLVLNTSRNQLAIWNKNATGVWYPDFDQVLFMLFPDRDPLWNESVSINWITAHQIWHSVNEIELASSATTFDWFNSLPCASRSSATWYKVVRPFPFKWWEVIGKKILAKFYSVNTNSTYQKVSVNTNCHITKMEVFLVNTSWVMKTILSKDYSVGWYSWGEQIIFEETAWLTAEEWDIILVRLNWAGTNSYILTCWSWLNHIVFPSYPIQISVD